jgi:hypothetical protein
VVEAVVAMKCVVIGDGVGRYLVQAGTHDGGFCAWLLLPSRDECNPEESTRRPAGRVRKI